MFYVLVSGREENQEAEPGLSGVQEEDSKSAFIDRWKVSRLSLIPLTLLMSLAWHGSLGLAGCFCKTARDAGLALGGSGRAVNSLDFCQASLKSLVCFYFWCILSSQWKAVTVNLQILHCQL